MQAYSLTSIRPGGNLDFSCWVSIRVQLGLELITLLWKHITSQLRGDTMSVVKVYCTQYTGFVYAPW